MSNKNKIAEYNKQLREVAKLATATPSVEELEAKIERLEQEVKNYYEYGFHKAVSEAIAECLVSEPRGEGSVGARDCMEIRRALMDLKPNSPGGDNE